jgi:hypothetical protein
LFGRSSQASVARSEATLRLICFVICFPTWHVLSRG